MDETTLITAVKAGSSDAFRLLLEPYEQRIYSAILRIVGDPVEAEDVAQDALFKAYRNLDSFQFDSGFYTWLYRIAVNAAVDTVKKRRRRTATSLDEDEWLKASLEAGGPAPDDEPEGGEMAVQLRRAIDTLPEKYRTILVLREYEGLTYEDLARVLKISKGTVESRLFRARMRLKDKMQKHL
ncbi:MAG: sigma-70 family RNA polymerase sigma factor [Planctomycetota bacterium]